MFYSQIILAKKGPLGSIWIAAHMDKKLNKNQISSTDIASSVESIIEPTVPLALRVRGHLLLGLVRIYKRKVNYLFTDCNDALVKIKMAFRPGVVDLPSTSQAASNAMITVAGFGEWANNMEDIDLDEQVLHAMAREEEDWSSFGGAQLNLSRHSDITLQSTPVRTSSSQSAYHFDNDKWDAFDPNAEANGSVEIERARDAAPSPAGLESNSFVISSTQKEIADKSAAKEEEFEPLPYDDNGNVYEEDINNFIDANDNNMDVDGPMEGGDDKNDQDEKLESKYLF
jgi:hypothetical protein